MAHLTKQQYSIRNENAAIRMMKNAENTALTDEQHEILRRLCAKRHEIHSNKDSVINDNTREFKSLIEINIELEENSINTMSFIPTDKSDYIDIDDFQTLYETEQIPEDEDEKQNWYDDNYTRISNELEILNTKIENYLSEIDAKYGTNYSPTGAQRIF